MKLCVITWSLMSRSYVKLFDISLSTGLTKCSWQHLTMSWPVNFGFRRGEESYCMQTSKIFSSKSSMHEILLNTAEVAQMPLFLSSWSFMKVPCEVSLIIYWINLTWSWFLLSMIPCSLSRRVLAVSSLILKSRSMFESAWSAFQSLNSLENAHMISICLCLLRIF